jgi:hypothetical protein
MDPVLDIIASEVYYSWQLLFKWDIKYMTAWNIFGGQPSCFIAKQ